MTPELILALVKITMEILEKHVGAKPTPEEVAAQISKEMAEGQVLIADWFAKKGLTPPK